MFVNIGMNNSNQVKVKVKDENGQIVEMNLVLLNPNPTAYDSILGEGMASMTINSGVS